MKTARFAVVALLAGSLALGSAAAPVHAQVQEPVVAEPAPTGVPDAEPAPGPAETAPAPAVTDALQPAPTATAGPSEAPDSGDAVEEPGSAASDEPAPDAEGEAGFDPVGPGHVVPGPDAPLETEADGSVHSLGEDHDLPAGAAAAGPLSALPFSAASRTGTIQVTLVLSTLADNRSWVNEAAARAAVNEANRYWREMSNGRLGISIKTVRRHDSQARSWEDYAQVMNTVSREIGWRESPYTALVAFTPAADLKVGGYGGFLGGGWTSTGTGGRILMPAPSGFTSNVVTHEFGHTLGLLHANSLQCTNGRSDVGASGSRWNDGACSSREYADTLDLMGYAQRDLPVINSFFWDQGGFGRGNEIRNLGQIGETRSVTLYPWGGTAANRAVKFADPVSGEVYYLELRQPSGYDEYLSSGPAGNRGVKITKADKVNSWSVFSLGIQPSTRPYGTLYGTNQAWQAGQTFTTHAGTSVRINSISSGSASVTITSVVGRAQAAMDAARSKHPELGKAVTSPIVLNGGGVFRGYERGAIHWSPASGARVTKGAIRGAWGSIGAEDGPLGYPTGDEYGYRGATRQDFQGGSIVWSAGTGAQVLRRGIGNAYFASGGPTGLLGLPIGGERALRGGAVQSFQKGVIYWSPGGGGQLMGGAVLNAYASLGYEAGRLGYPLSGERSVKGGRVQDFAGGHIYWSAKAGAHATFGGIGNAYSTSGGPSGVLGLPTASEKNIPGGALQNFEKGTVYWSAQSGARLIPAGKIASSYASSGAQRGRLGFPTSNQYRSGAATVQDFDGGRIVTSAAGTFLLVGAIGNSYFHNGGPAGSLGIPSGSEQNLGNGGVSQQFTGGTVYWTSDTGAWISKGAIRTAYASLRYHSGRLGYPTSNEYGSGRGVLQNYQGGWIAWSSTTGAHPFYGAIGNTYMSTGGPGGRLGLPTGAEETTGGRTVQTYEHGSISWTPHEGTKVTYR
ncbi:LGFP repeat [Arthrobacter saudimassiliensis]|uniref:LGFP repeat n=1 Tax=Arthrobacter saudimassiliensis TaxID=1461584 RepID=A0A078MU54_9MICC|nr:LGFP repeat [Arthrobacter saudimassiliensis]